MKWKDRACDDCGKVEYTASKSNFCRMCAEAKVRDEKISQEPNLLLAHGYSVISGPTMNRFNKRVYKVSTPCGHEWEAVFGNLIKQIKNAEAKKLRPACGECGPKHRMKVALGGFMDKYARDYDLAAFEDYRKKVRGLSEVTYRNNRDIINPLSKTRGHHEHHLDHIIPIIECFKQGWTPEKASAATNLQMLHCKDNLSKGSS